MAEYISTAEQTVDSLNNVIFTSTSVPGTKCIIHNDNSGLVTLRGITNQCYARFLVNFSGNIAIPTGGTAQEISLSISTNGETIGSSTMRVVPAAVNNYFNVSKSEYIVVPKGCCVTLSIKNTSGQDILVESANLIVTRVA